MKPKPKPNAGSKGKGKGNSTGGPTASGGAPADSGPPVGPNPSPLPSAAQAAPSTQTLAQEVPGIAPNAIGSMSAIETAPYESEGYDRGLAEVCISPESRVGRATSSSEGCNKLRITRQEDITKQSGVDFACNAIYGPYDVVFMSLPCVGGCPWNYVNATKGP